VRSTFTVKLMDLVRYLRRALRVASFIAIFPAIVLQFATTQVVLVPKRLRRSIPITAEEIRVGISRLQVRNANSNGMKWHEGQCR